MTRNKVESPLTPMGEMLGRIAAHYKDTGTEGYIIDPTRLAEILVEMEEKLEVWNPAYGDKEADKEAMWEERHHQHSWGQLEREQEHANDYNDLVVKFCYQRCVTCGEIRVIND